MRLRAGISFEFEIVCAVIAAAVAGEIALMLRLEEWSGVIASAMFVMTIFVISHLKSH